MRLTPDGARYLAMGAGHRQPLPFHLRWALPAALGTNELAWIVVNALSIVAAGLLTGWLALGAGATEIQALLAALIIWGLPSVKFASSAPVLTDMPGLALALAAAVLWPIEPIVAVGVAMLAGCVSEKAPIVASLVAWQPWLLVGLVVVLGRLLVKHAALDPKDPLYATLANPLRTGLDAHRGHWRSAGMVLPWGACLLVLAEPTVQVGAALLFGYSLLLIATDTVRLYQQAAPALVIAAALMVPDAWVPAVAVAHWFNPFQGGGL